jgi:hypothetical protein
MALGEVVVPYLDSPNDFAWRSSLAASRDRMQFALDGLDASPMREDRRPNNRDILQNNIAFMDECLKTNAISADALQGFAKKQSPPNLNLSEALWRSFLYIFNVDSALIALSVGLVEWGRIERMIGCVVRTFRVGCRRLRA